MESNKCSKTKMEVSVLPCASGSPIIFETAAGKQFVVVRRKATMSSPRLRCVNASNSVNQGRAGYILSRLIVPTLDYGRIEEIERH